jgi:hypothetical protein
MVIDIPTQWRYGQKVPFTENNHIEFKEVAIFSGLFKNTSTPSSGLPKYRDTLIGFLNGGGGYLFMGIRDDGTIVGVNDMTNDSLDKLKLWVDSTFNILVHRDGRPLDPSETQITVTTFPVEDTAIQSHVVLIEVIYTGELLDIMTRGGTVVYRLNASNYKISSEPIYRKRDVQGMIRSIQAQMQSVINDKHKALKLLQETHREQMETAIRVEKERSEEQMRMVMSQVSESLYSIYRPLKKSYCERIVDYLLRR